VRVDPSQNKDRYATRVLDGQGPSIWSQFRAPAGEITENRRPFHFLDYAKIERPQIQLHMALYHRPRTRLSVLQEAISAFSMYKRHRSKGRGTTLLSLELRELSSFKVPGQKGSSQGFSLEGPRARHELRST